MIGGGDDGGMPVGSGTSTGNGSLIGDGPGIGLSGIGDGGAPGSGLGVICNCRDSWFIVDSNAGMAIPRDEKKRGSRPFLDDNGISDP